MAAHLPTDARTHALVRELYRLTSLDLLLSRRDSARGPRMERRAAVVEQLWARAPFGHQDPCPVSGLSADEADFARFFDLSAGYRRPVVIRGFGRDTEAVKRWSAEHLVERLGSTPCTVVEMDDAAMARPHDSKRVLHRLPFDEFVRRMREEPLYLHNSSEFAEVSGLLDGLGIERINSRLCDPESTWDEIFASNLFVGTERVYSNLHCAPGGNFFLQIAGRKTWTLVDPALSPYLCPLTARPFNHCLSIYGSYHAQSDDCPIWRLPRQTVTLEPGDLLYNPPWWWHEVINHGDTIGCALRHVPRPFDRSPTWANHPLFSALSIFPRLWALSAVDYARHRLGGRGSMRAIVNPMLAATLNRARGRTR